MRAAAAALPARIRHQIASRPDWDLTKVLGALDRYGSGGRVTAEDLASVERAARTAERARHAASLLRRDLDGDGRLTRAEYLNRGNLLSDLGEFERAIADYDTAIRLDPGYTMAYNNRGATYHDLGLHRRALADFAKAIRIDPGHHTAYEGRARTLAALGEPGRAAREWERALALGGPRRVLGWQDRLAEKGHYLGPFDGTYSPALERALLDCARDPDC